MNGLVLSFLPAVLSVPWTGGGWPPKTGIVVSEPYVPELFSGKIGRKPLLGVENNGFLDVFP